MKHTCHARDCERVVPRSYLMCGPHWGQVPFAIQQDVLHAYQPGQERTMRPSRAFLVAARAAVNAVAAHQAAAEKGAE